MSDYPFGAPPLPPPPTPPMMTTRRLSVLLVVLVIVGVVGIVLAVTAGGSGSSKADPTSSVPPPTSSSVDRGPGTGICALPDNATPDNSLQMSIALGGVLSGTLTAPIARWRYVGPDGVPHSVYCFENVTQSDFGLAIGYIGNRGWVKQSLSGSTETWKSSTDPNKAVDPTNVIVTASGGLVFTTYSSASNVGSVKIEWY